MTSYQHTFHAERFLMFVMIYACLFSQAGHEFPPYLTASLFMYRVGPLVGARPLPADMIAVGRLRPYRSHKTRTSGIVQPLTEAQLDQERRKAPDAVAVARLRERMATYGVGAESVGQHVKYNMRPVEVILKRGDAGFSSSQPHVKQWYAGSKGTRSGSSSSRKRPSRASASRSPSPMRSSMIRSNTSAGDGEPEAKTSTPLMGAMASPRRSMVSLALSPRVEGNRERSATADTQGDWGGTVMTAESAGDVFYDASRKERELLESGPDKLDLDTMGIVDTATLDFGLLY